MALNVSPVNPGVSRAGSDPIVVELSDRQLPARMRFDAMRTELRMPRPWAGIVRRALMAPVAMIVRFLSR